MNVLTPFSLEDTMKIPCNRCGGTKKQFEYKAGYKTKKLISCKQCKGKGWYEADPVGNGERPNEYGWVLPSRSHD